MTSQPLAVYGRGSFFAGAPAPKDIDLVVVSDGPCEWGPDDYEAALEAYRLRTACDLPVGLPMDVHHVDITADLSTYERAVIYGGVLLVGDGDEMMSRAVEVLWPEWAFYMGAAANEKLRTEPEVAAIHAVRGILCPQVGVAPSSRWRVLQDAEGTQWESLVRASWEWRPWDGQFRHQDLDDALLACWQTALGDPVHLVDGTWAGTRWRRVFDICSEADCDGPATMESTPQPQGWSKAVVEERDWWGQLLLTLAWFTAAGQDLDGPVSIDAPEFHVYPVGSEFAPHVDRLDEPSGAFVAQAAMAGTDVDEAMMLVRDRDANVIVMMRPADAGGMLQVRASQDGPPRTVGLNPGDVMVLDSGVWHGVTRIEAGERRTMVAHTHRGP